MEEHVDLDSKSPRPMRRNRIEVKNEMYNSSAASFRFLPLKVMAVRALMKLFLFTLFSLLELLNLPPGVPGA